MNRHRAALLLLALPGLTLWAQGNPPRFEAISIHRNTAGPGGQSTDTTPGRLKATNVPLADLLRYAFRVRKFQISGMPEDLGAERFNISATTGNTKQLTDEQLAPWLLTMLADRFGLSYHRETKDLPIYSLTAGPSNTLKPHTGETAPSFRSDKVAGKWVWRGTKKSMQDLTDALSSSLERIVRNDTGLTGEFDFSLEFLPFSLSRTDEIDDSGPSIFAALEQLGLKLKSTKGPVETIVIDSLTEPTEN